MTPLEQTHTGRTATATIDAAYDQRDVDCCIVPFQTTSLLTCRTSSHLDHPNFTRQ